MNRASRSLAPIPMSVVATAAVLPACAFAFAGVLALSGCGGPPPSALENRTFYQYDDRPGIGKNPFESPYPPLDQKATATSPEYVGVSILGGTVHLSRPASWKIRRASLTPERRYVEYVSPNQYLWAVYERPEKASRSWDKILAPYEEDAKAKGAELLGLRVPVATWNAQGREYVVRRTVKGQRGAYANTSRETMLRGENHVDLVELVHQGDSPALIGGELLRVMETLEVL